ncbi:MAG: hypothetical protein ABIQ97_00470 [Lysobacteraceae bacterium]
MITLLEKGTTRTLGTISEGELQQLIDALEEEDQHDRDYYVDQQTINYLRERNVTPHLLGLLERGLGSRSGFDVEWTSDEPDSDDEDE